MRLPDGPLHLLCLGAHSDDIEIGCGGTVLQLLAAHPGSTVDYVCLSSNPEREAEARAAAEDLLSSAAAATLRFGGFRDGFFPFEGAQIKDYFESTLKALRPDIVFTHARADRHQDHRLVSDLTWNTFRDHLVLEYEIPKWDGDLGQPNVYIPLHAATAERKVDLLMRHFGTQRSKRWFTPATFAGLMRLRGIEAGVDQAEAFTGRKIIWR
ncbi:MAG: PIG-L deacetylase family protein [Bacteroidota bacterium]